MPRYEIEWKTRAKEMIQCSHLIPGDETVPHKFISKEHRISPSGRDIWVDIPMLIVSSSQVRAIRLLVGEPRKCLVSFCSFAFQDEESLLDHMLTAHRMELYKEKYIIRCQIPSCDWEVLDYPDAGELRRSRHLKVIHSDGRVTCPVCERPTTEIATHLESFHAMEDRGGGRYKYKCPNLGCHWNVLTTIENGPELRQRHMINTHN